MSSTTTTTLLRLSLLLALLSHVCCWTKPCRLQGRRHECMAASYVPGFSLGGEGFDVTTLQRKGAYVINMKTFLNSDGTCTLYCNPLQGGKLQKVPLSISEWRSFKRCPFNLHGSSHNSVSSLVQAYTIHESDDWQLGVDFDSELEVAGSRSKVAQFATTKAKEDRFTYTIHKLSCSQYSYRLSDKPILDSNFLYDVESLPKTCNSSTTMAPYRRFVDTYGTHYIRQVYLGGKYRSVSAIRTCLSTLNGLSSSEVESCLRLGLTDGFGMFTYPRSKSTCSKVLTNKHLTMYYSGGLFQNFTEVTGGRGWTGQMSLTQNNSAGYNKWLTTLKDYPEAIKYSLKPIHMLVRDAPRRAGVKAAIEQYMNEKGIRPQSSSPSSCDNRVPNLASDCCPQNAWRGTLVVTVVRAYRLNGDVWSETDAYVKLWYGSIQRTTPVVLSDNPRWDACYKLGKVDTYIGLNLKVEVWDDDFASDDLLGSCVKNVRQGTHKHTCATSSGGLELIIQLTCDNHLTGSRCEQYKPSPTWHAHDTIPPKKHVEKAASTLEKKTKH